MRNEFLPFTRPAINEADIRAVTEVLRSGWITNGPQNAALESGVCEITGNRFGVALSSGDGGHAPFDEDHEARSRR